MSNGWTVQDMQRIERLNEKIAKTLRDSGETNNICASAVMTTCARIAVFSEETDEFIIDQFRKTLLSARQCLEQFTGKAAS